jgi:DNA-binding PadR family transcriptional regulator
VIDPRRFGRFAGPARLVLAALRDGPRHPTRLFDDVRALDGPIGPGTLYGAIARLERLGLIERTANGSGRRAYRLRIVTTASAAAGGADGGVAR